MTRLWIAATLSVAIAGFAHPSAAQVQNDDQQACLISTASAASKLAKTRIKEYAKCLKSAAAGSLVGCSAEDCLASDTGGKIEAGLTKLRDSSEDRCSDTPDFGYRHPSIVGSVVLEETIGFHDDVLGPDLDDSAVLKTADPAAAGCQGKVLKASTKMLLAMSALYDACRKEQLGDEAISSVAGLTACLAAIDADAKGKVASAASGVAATISGSCDGIDLSSVLPGACGDAADVGACIEERARCRACRRADGSDDLGTDCDLFDNSQADSSCTGVSGRCNGRADLCDRDFDDVAYATTHNAYSNAEEHWTKPNQRYGLTRQLAEGVRSMMLDTYEFEGGLWFCHADCTIGSGSGGNIGKSPLVEGLVKIREALETHPTAILSIIFESYITEAQTEQVFDDAGLLPYVHAQPVGTPWPTLQAMIDSGKRLIVFTDDSSVSLPWHHYVWDFAWETPYSFSSAEDFVCTINRGDMGNSLYIFNHFLTQTFGSQQLANQVNFNPLLEDRALQCQTESGRLPNFITMDYYNTGDVFPVVDTLNGFGRCEP